MREGGTYSRHWISDTIDRHTQFDQYVQPSPATGTLSSSNFPALFTPVSSAILSRSWRVKCTAMADCLTPDDYATSDSFEIKPAGSAYPPQTYSSSSTPAGSASSGASASSTFASPSSTSNKTSDSGRSLSLGEVIHFPAFSSVIVAFGFLAKASGRDYGL